MERTFKNECSGCGWGVCVRVCLSECLSCVHPGMRKPFLCSLTRCLLLLECVLLLLWRPASRRASSGKTKNKKRGGKKKEKSYSCGGLCLGEHRLEQNSPSILQTKARTLPLHPSPHDPLCPPLYHLTPFTPLSRTSNHLHQPCT